MMVFKGTKRRYGGAKCRCDGAVKIAQWYGDTDTPGTRGAVRGVQWCDVGGTVVRRRGYNGTM